MQTIQRYGIMILSIILFIEAVWLIKLTSMLDKEIKEKPVQIKEEQVVEKEIEVIPAVIEVHPFDSMTYRPKWRASGIAELRKVEYGVGNSKEIIVEVHTGGYILDMHKARKTIEAVFQRLPNIKTSPGLVDLILETMITETWMGREPWIKSIKLYKNYGIVQFRMDTAKETVGWLKTVREDVHDAVMQFYNDKKDFEWNLTNNIPFGIALAVEYYWRVIPNINDRIKTLEDRAQCWKGYYNTSLGLGTVNKYINRVNKFKKQYADS